MYLRIILLLYLLFVFSVAIQLDANEAQISQLGATRNVKQNKIRLLNRHKQKLLRSGSVNNIITNTTKVQSFIIIEEKTRQEHKKTDFNFKPYLLS